MFKNLLTGLVFKWLARRGLELGGLLGIVASFDPSVIQSLFATIGALLTGDFENVSLGALIGLATTIGGLIWNAKSTFTPHATVDNEQVSLDKLAPDTKAKTKKEVKRVVEARKDNSILGRIFDRASKRK